LNFHLGLFLTVFEEFQIVNTHHPRNIVGAMLTHHKLLVYTDKFIRYPYPLSTNLQFKSF